MKVYASAEMTLTDTNDGISVTGIDRYYMASSSSSGITVDSKGWMPDPQETNLISRYHWSYEVVNYSDGEAIPSKPAVIGVYGDSAKMLYLSATAESMTFDADGAPNPSSQEITLTANLQNVSGNASFVATAYNGSTVVSDVVLSGVGNTRTFNQAQFPASANRVHVRATLGNLVDTVTIVKLSNGSKGQNAVVGLLTNESITLPANKDGLVSNFTGATGVFDVYDGITKKTGSGVVTYSLVSQSNITVAINATTGVYSVTAMPTGTTVLNGYAVLSAIYNGVTIEKQLNVSKSVTGATGAQGQQGIQGPAGTNGTSQYVHIRYSANSNGSDMTPTPQSNTQYIGLANTTSATAPAVNTSYTWTKTKGETGAQGNQGIQGPAGTNGQTTYTWVKYADTNTGTGMNDNPDGKPYIGLAFNKTTQTESNTASDYTWSLMPQNIEVSSRNLILGTAKSYILDNNTGGNLGYDGTYAYPDYHFAKGENQGEWLMNNGLNAGDVITVSGTVKFTKHDGTSLKRNDFPDGFEMALFRFVGNGSSWQHSNSLEKNQLIDNVNTYHLSTQMLINPLDITIPGEVIPHWWHCYFPAGYSVEFTELIINKGTKNLGWTPAPEDIQSELDDKASNEYVTSVETTLNTTIEKSAGEFRMEMSESYTSKSEFGTYKETVSSQFDQTAKDFGMTFKNLIEQIETLDGETKATFDEIVKYIRFVDGNIILGKVGNELGLKIRHDRIQFIQSGVEVAYFSNNKLYVTDGEFINSLKLGNFAFIPRENGSLDFRKVVS